MSADPTLWGLLAILLLVAAVLVFLTTLGAQEEREQAEREAEEERVRLARERLARELGLNEPTDPRIDAATMQMKAVERSLPRLDPSAGPRPLTEPPTVRPPPTPPPMTAPARLTEPETQPFDGQVPAAARLSLPSLPRLDDPDASPSASFTASATVRSPEPPGPAPSPFPEPEPLSRRPAGQVDPPPPPPPAPPAPPTGTLGLTLARAGFDGRRHGGWYFATKLLLAFGGAGLALAVEGVGSGTQLFLALLAATVGFTLPSAILRIVGQNRQSRIQGELPDLLDLMVTCLEAGMGLDEAVRRASSELGRYGSPLARELAITSGQWASGKDRFGAIGELRVRTGLSSVAEFLESVEEARRDGTHITESLRAQAEVLRKEEAARAEAWARRAPLLVAVNLAIFMLPAAFVGVLGSSIVKAVRLLLPNLP